MRVEAAHSGAGLAWALLAETARQVGSSGRRPLVVLLPAGLGPRVGPPATTPQKIANSYCHCGVGQDLSLSSSAASGSSSVPESSTGSFFGAAAYGPFLLAATSRLACLVPGRARHGRSGAQFNVGRQTGPDPPRGPIRPFFRQNRLLVFSLVTATVTNLMGAENQNLTRIPPLVVCLCTQISMGLAAVPEPHALEGSLSNISRALITAN